MVRLFAKDESKDNVEAGEAAESNSRISRYKELMYAAAKMSLILFYFYVCDRLVPIIKMVKNSLSGD